MAVVVEDTVEFDDEEDDDEVDDDGNDDMGFWGNPRSDMGPLLGLVGEGIEKRLALGGCWRGSTIISEDSVEAVVLARKT